MDKKGNSNIQLTREVDGSYRVATPQSILITKEEIEKYSYVESKQTKTGSFNFFTKASMGARDKKVAKYIGLAATCDGDEKEILRQKAIKLLKMPTATDNIAKAIAEEKFADNLGIYAEVHSACCDTIKQAYVLANSKPSEQAFDNIIKYIDDFNIKVCRHNETLCALSELYPRQYEVVLGLMQQKGQVIEMPYIRMKTKDVEKGLKAGVFVVKGKDLLNLKRTIHYYGDYFKQFIDEAVNMETDHIVNNVKKSVGDFEPAWKKEQSELSSKVDELIHQTAENVEKDM